MKYVPNLISAGDIVLSPELLRLTEQIAANVHDVWSVVHLAEGWQYSETIDEVCKLHPRPYFIQPIA